MNNNPIVIVYHSGYGHTAKVAEGVAEGSGGFLLAIDAEGNLPTLDGVSGWDRIAAARTVIFGSPTYMGSVSWQFKKFADASSKPWFTQVWKDKLAAGFTNSSALNGDKLSTLHYLFTLSQQHSMIWVSAGMLPSNASAIPVTTSTTWAATRGLLTATPSDASTHEMVPGDLATAHQFGKRVKDVTARFQG
jgi:multimeric flavodoxin WrbA